MNKARRKEIYNIIIRLESLQGNDSYATETLEDIYTDIDVIYDDEYEYMENIPENMQGGARYEAAEEACDNLDNAKDSVQSAINSDNCEERDEYISEAIEYLESASI